MGKGLFVTATGTDMGKTYVAALMVKELKDRSEEHTSELQSH